MLLRLLHRFGFGVQSPWAYSLVKDVLLEKLHYYAYDDMKAKYGNLSHYDRKQNEQLFRIVNHFHPSRVTIFGKVDDATIDYISKPHSAVIIECCEASEMHCVEDNELVLVQPCSQLESLLLSFPSSSILVVEDISKSNKELWKSILDNKSATATFDIKYRGIAFFDPNREKQNINL